MFIVRKLQKIPSAPEEPNMAGFAHSSPETLRSSGARIGGFSVSINIRLLRSQLLRLYLEIYL
jgi:hypothetical protein